MIYLYKEMTEEKWDGFIVEIEEAVGKLETEEAHKIDTEERLNKIWSKIEQIIKVAANRNIPKTKVAPKTFYAFSTKATKLHSALRKINAVIRQIQAGDKEEETLQNINKEISEIEKLSQSKIEIMLTKNDTEKELEEKVEKLKAY